MQRRNVLSEYVVSPVSLFHGGRRQTFSVILDEIRQRCNHADVGEIPLVM